MQALRSGELSILVFLIFFVLLLSGLAVSHIVKKMRWEIVLAEYEARRGPVEKAPELPPKEDILPGYTLLTYQDYAQMEQELLRQMTGQKSASADRGCRHP